MQATIKKYARPAWAPALDKKVHYLAVKRSLTPEEILRLNELVMFYSSDTDDTLPAGSKTNYSKTDFIVYLVGAWMDESRLQYEHKDFHLLRLIVDAAVEIGANPEKKSNRVYGYSLLDVLKKRQGTESERNSVFGFNRHPPDYRRKHMGRVYNGPIKNINARIDALFDFEKSMLRDIKDGKLTSPQKRAALARQRQAAR